MEQIFIWNISSFMKNHFFILKVKNLFKKLVKSLFTHFGLSGPLILNSATAVADLLFKWNCYRKNRYVSRYRFGSARSKNNNRLLLMIIK